MALGGVICSHLADSRAVQDTCLSKLRQCSQRRWVCNRPGVSLQRQSWRSKHPELSPSGLRQVPRTPWSQIRRGGFGLPRTPRRQTGCPDPGRQGTFPPILASCVPRRNAQSVPRYAAVAWVFHGLRGLRCCPDPGRWGTSPPISGCFAS